MNEEEKRSQDETTNYIAECFGLKPGDSELLQEISSKGSAEYLDRCIDFLRCEFLKKFYSEECKRGYFLKKLGIEANGNMSLEILETLENEVMGGIYFLDESPKGFPNYTRDLEGYRKLKEKKKD